jgi:hypothetical protein
MGRGVKQRGKKRILTETPVKEELEQMVKNRKRSQKKVVTTLPNKAKKPRPTDRGEDSEDELQEFLFVDDSSDESLNLGETEPDDVFDVNVLAANDFVLVKFVIRKGNVFYVGRVEGLVDADVEVTFLNKMGQNSSFLILLTRLQFQKMTLS